MVVSKFLNPKNDIVFKRIFGSEKNKDILIVPFWEKNPALAVRSFSIYNTLSCNTIDDHLIQSMTAPTISFEEPSIDIRFW